MHYPLSICVPAYDRSQCLDELLQSIILHTDQNTPVQICVSDDAAPPATEAVVRRWQALYPHIVYHRNAENGGLDRNILKSVELADGDYCWLMGDDDKVEPDAVTSVIRKIEEFGRPTALSLNGALYDRNLTTPRRSPARGPAWRKNKLRQDTAFNDLDAIIHWFGDSFGFIGETVVHRESWRSLFRRPT